MAQAPSTFLTKDSKLLELQSPADAEILVRDGLTVAGKDISEFDVNDLIWDRYEDLRAPATAINPPGAASDPNRDTGDGTLLFDAGGTELVFVLMQLPHSYKEGTDVSPHIHWCKTTSAGGNVIWQMRYRVYRIGEVAEAWSTLTTASVLTADADTAELHAMAEWEDVSGTLLGISDTIIFQVQRTGGAGADTYGADARLLEFDIHYQADSSGSAAEFTK